jgi:hypothetical protein
MLQIVLALYPLCLAGVALVWTIRSGLGATFRWLVEVATSASIGLFAFLAGPWAFTSYYLRYALLLLLALLVFRAYRRRRLDGTAHKNHGGAWLAFSAPLLFVFLALNASAVGSHFRPRESFEISFPLAGATYYVLQGGNSAVTNPFHTLAGSKLALDIVSLNAFGNRAAGIAPRALGDYEIYGDVVRSPCAGTVMAVRSDLPDHAPGEPDVDHPEGNHVVVICGEVEVLMAHLMRGSTMVAVGEVVSTGQPLASVGNSGNTLEPHLHIGARRGGLEVGLVLSGRQLSLNSVVPAGAAGIAT